MGRPSKTHIRIPISIGSLVPQEAIMRVFNSPTVIALAFWLATAGVAYAAKIIGNG
jgi:hypothetical protein